jgi:hypothetical protein
MEKFMKWTWSKTLVTTVLGTALVWGGAPAAQQVAPSHVSRIVLRDLRAVRKGNKVELIWSQPLAITSRQSTVSHLVSANICRSISSQVPALSDPIAACAQSVGKVTFKKSSGAVANATYGKSNTEITMRFTDSLPEGPENESLQFAIYNLELRDDHGRTAGFSNSVPVLLTPTPAVEEFHSQVDERGVYLIWQDGIENRPSSVQFDYRIYRREKGSSRKTAIPYLRALIHTREGDRWTGVDTNIEWEKTYSYWVTPVAKVYAENGNLISEIQGEDSAPIQVTAHDLFPPAVPERLLAKVSHSPKSKFVDLIWAPNTEKDVAGYNVYRREEGGQMARINSAPITMLSFQDTNVAAGRTYWYCISAVDLRANESAKSQEIAAILKPVARQNSDLP